MPLRLLEEPITEKPTETSYSGLRLLQDIMPHNVLKTGAKAAFENEKQFIPTIEDLSLGLEGIGKFVLQNSYFQKVTKDKVGQITPEETRAILKTISFPLRQVTRPFEAARAGIGAVIEGKPPLRLLEDVGKGFVSPEKVPTLTSKIPFQDWEQGDWTKLIPRAIAEGIENFAIYNIGTGGRIVNQLSKVVNYRQGLIKIEQSLPLFEKAGVNFPGGMTNADKISSIISFARTNPEAGQVVGKILAMPSEFYSGLPIKFKVGDIVKVGEQSGEIVKITTKGAMVKIGEQLVKANLSQIDPTESLKEPTKEPSEVKKIDKGGLNGYVVFKGDKSISPFLNTEKQANDWLMKQPTGEGKVNIFGEPATELGNAIINKLGINYEKIKLVGEHSKNIGERRDARAILRIVSDRIEEPYKLQKLAEFQPESDLFKKAIFPTPTGEGKVVYHGTGEVFKDFDVKKSADGSVWFTDNKSKIENGEVSATGKGQIMERIIDENKLKLGGWEEQDKFSTDELIAKGYDGLKLVDKDETTYQIFNPEKLSTPIGQRLLDISKQKGYTVSEGESKYYELSDSERKNLPEPQKGISQSPLKIKYKKQGYLLFPQEEINSPADIAFAFQYLKNEPVERFLVVGTKNNKVISIEPISIGTINSALVSPFEPLHLLNSKSANGYYLVHNHPSGNIDVSIEDVTLTQKFRKAYETLGLEYKGHIIIDDTKFGLLKPDGSYEGIEHSKSTGKEIKKPYYSKYIEWKDTKIFFEQPIVSPKYIFEISKGLVKDYEGNSLVFYLNTRNIIIATEFIPTKKISPSFLAKSAVSIRSNQIILVNSGISDNDLKNFQTELNLFDIKLLDDIKVNEKSFKSAQDEGLIKEKLEKYGEGIYIPIAQRPGYFENLKKLSDEQLVEGFEKEWKGELSEKQDELKGYLAGKLKLNLKFQGEYTSLKHLNWLFTKEGERGYTPDELVGELQGMGFNVENDNDVRDLIKDYFKEEIQAKSEAFVRKTGKQAQAKLKAGLVGKSRTKILEELRMQKLNTIANQLSKLSEIAPHLITPKQIAYIHILKQKNLLTDIQFSRLKNIFAGKSSLKVTTPTGKLKKEPMTQEEAQDIIEGIKGIVPQRPLITGQPPKIPLTRALVISEWNQPFNDLTLFQAAPLSGLDPVRAAEIVDGKEYGPVRRYIVEPARNAERISKLELKRTLGTLTKISKGMSKKSKQSELTFKYIEKTLTSEEEKLVTQDIINTANYLSSKYDELLNRINEARASLKKIPIQKRQDYVTHIQELNLLDEFFQGLSNIPDDVVNIPPFSKSNSPFFKFALQRLGSKEFMVDAIAAFETYANKAYSVIYNTPILKSARPLAERLPHNAYKYFSQYLDEVMGLRPTQGDKLVPRPLLSGITWLRHQMGKGAILGNFASVFNQPFTLPYLTSSVEPKFIASTVLKAHTSEWRAFVEKYSKTVQGRIFEIDFDPTTLSKIENAMGFLLQWSDREMVRISFGAAFEKYLAEGNTFEDAIRKADDIAFKTQSGFNYADLPPAFRSKMASSFLQFQNTVNNGLNFLKFDLGKEGKERGKWGIFKKALIWLGTLLVLNKLYRQLGVPGPIDNWTDLFPLISLAEYGSPATYSFPTSLLQVLTVKDPMDQAKARKALKRSIFLFIPGGNQVRKTLQGIVAVSKGGKFDKRGKLMFPIREPLEQGRALLFGPYGTKAGTRFLENRFEGKKQSGLRLLQ